MFSHSIKLVTLSGFDVKVDPSWLLIAALIVWSLSSGYFPQVVEGESQATYLILALFGMLGFMISLVLHELSHSVVARRFGVEIKGITLFVFGGVAELGSEPKTPGAEFWIAVAGPAMSFSLAFFFWVFSAFAGLGQSSELFAVVLLYLALINLILAVFNLLPAFPLDGGRVYRAILWNKSGNFLDATRRAAELGTRLAYVLIALGLLSVFSGRGLGGFWQVFIGMFLLTAAKGTYQQALISAALDGKTVANLMSRATRTAAPDQSLSELADTIMLPHRTSFVPVVEEGVLLGYVDGDVLAKIDRENWPTTRVGDVFVAVDETNAIAPSSDVTNVFERMTNEGRRKFLVCEDRRLLGVITLADMMEYLAVLQQIGVPSSQQFDRKSG